MVSGMDRKIDVSIIVPVYNTEKYVKRCIDSIINQKLDNYEIVVVDDCSTDQSFEVVSDLSKKCKQIRVYRNEQNMGAGYTKNRALSLCMGKYVCFVDSDDWLMGNLLPDILQLTEQKNADDIFYEGTSVSIGQELLEGNDTSFLEINCEYEKGKDFLEYLLDSKTLVMSANRHFFKRELLNEKMKFSENSVNDDCKFTMLLLCNVGTVISLKNKIYAYYQRETGRISNHAQKVSLIKETYEHACEIYSEIQTINKEYEDISKKCFRYLMCLVQNDYVKNKKNGLEEYAYLQQKLEQQPTFSQLFEQAKNESPYGIVDKEVMSKIKTKKSIYIYGAGTFGVDVYRVLTQNGVAVAGFIETKVRISEKCGIMVQAINEVELDNESYVVVAVSKKYREEIIPILEMKNGISYGVLINGDR